MTKAANRADLRSLSLEELGVLVERMGEKPFRARQLFRWIHHKGAASLDHMTDLPRAFRERLAGETRLTTLAVDTVQRSSDGTRKYRLRTEDGKFIEAVYMPEEPGPDAFDPEADEEEDEVARHRLPPHRHPGGRDGPRAALQARPVLLVARGIVDRDVEEVGFRAEHRNGVRDVGHGERL